MKESLSERSSDYLENRLRQKNSKVHEINGILKKIKENNSNTGINCIEKIKLGYLKEIQVIEQEQQRRRELLQILSLGIQNQQGITDIPLRYLVFGANGQRALLTLETNNITTLGQVIEKLKKEGDEGLLQLPGFYKQKLFYLKQILKEHKISYTCNLQLTGS